MSNSFKRCPVCKKVISVEATDCKHCGSNFGGENIENDKENDIFIDYENNTNTLIPRIFLGFVIAVLFFSFFYDVLFRITHLIPKIDSLVSETIDTSKNPIQKAIKPPKLITVNIGPKRASLLLQAEYSLSGMVVAQNTNFWLRGFLRNEFDHIALFDIGTVWGEIADKRLLKKHFKIKSVKTLSQSRRIYYSWRNISLGEGYINSHISHNHIIPANDNIISALFKIKKWQKVKLDGYLVDIINPDNSVIYTSLSRYDIDETSRGGGSCEIFYVTGIQIDNKYYK